MIKYLFVGLLFVCGVARAQDLGGQVQVDSYFHSVALHGPIQASIHPLDQGDTVSRAVITIEGLMVKEVPWKVVNSCLEVDAERGILERKGRVQIDIYIQDLRKLSTKGATIEAVKPITTENLFIETLGATNRMRINLWAKNLTVTASGDSDLSFSGQVEAVTLKALVNSRIDLLHCVARNALVEASASSEVYLYMLDRLDAKASWGATIYYLTPSADPTLSIKELLWGAVVPIVPPQVAADAR